ncbi:MAG: DNA photolyase [Deltaproteobacteria bacterium]|nr:DNA photolyase [Deltaproteobacteria bacterium]
MRKDRIKKILVEHGAADHNLTSSVLKRLDNLPVENIIPDFPGQRHDFQDMDKETLRLIKFKGEVLKPCPGTRGYICCGYQILHVGTNCPLDCSYCILQAYFNQPSLRIFVNLEDELIRIGQIIDSHPDKIFRIGTGEFTDSLALDHVAGWSDILPHFFTARKNAVLELKTKTERIEGLLTSQYRDRIIVSWSLNSPYIVSKEEHGAPSIKKRLLAAKRCQAEGFTLGFHFDPMIQHPEWKEDYMRTIEMIDRFIDPKGIIWISLGCLRYMPALKSIIRRRHPGTHILDGEFVRGLDGKMRYFKPIRMEIYSFIGEVIKKWYNDPGLYLCMESDEIWHKSLGWSPENTDGLSLYLDKRVIEFFG